MGKCVVVINMGVYDNPHVFFTMPGLQNYLYPCHHLLCVGEGVENQILWKHIPSKKLIPSKELNIL